MRDLFAGQRDRGEGRCDVRLVHDNDDGCLCDSTRRNVRAPLGKAKTPVFKRIWLPESAKRLAKKLKSMPEIEFALSVNQFWQ
jgi:hypothetical protein